MDKNTLPAADVERYNGILQAYLEYGRVCDALIADTLAKRDLKKSAKRVETLKKKLDKTAATDLGWLLCKIEDVPYLMKLVDKP
jgi:hypothetical protein